MEEKQREQKRARTTRSDYLADVDEVQAWIRQAELKVQDRSVEPAVLREHLRQIQNELGTISDKLERLTRNGRIIVENTRDDAEKELINNTITNLSEQLAQVKSWLEEKKQIVGDTMDAWQRFLTLYEAVKAWTEEKRQFLVEPLKLSTLVQARQRLHEYSTAVKSCKQVNKNLSDMGRELENIGQVTSVGDLPEKLAEAEEGKVQVEGQLLERNALLQEASEEWEQCERKMKDVRSWMEKARQTLESPQNKKKPLRDQHAIREKMLSDIAIQKTKITISVEKLEVHFRSGIGGDNRVKETADDLIAELNALHSTVKEQTASLEVCLAQIDQYQQEIQQLRQHIVQVEQQLRTVLSPTYLPNDREKALQEQQNLQQRMEGWKQRSKILVDQIHAVDPYYVPTNEYRFIGQASYADIAAGRTSPSSRNCSPYRQQRDATPPATATTTQVLRPAITRVQKLTAECPPGEVTKARAQRGDANLDKPKPQPHTETHVQTVQDQSAVGAEDDHQDVSEVVVETAARRGRSPTRKTNSPRMKEPLIAREEEIDKKYDNPRPGANFKQEARAEIPRNTLVPHEERRGRSPSPMWVPGSTSYADILRGCLQTTQMNVASPAEPPRQEMVPLSGESRRGRAEVPRAEQTPVKVEVTGNVMEPQPVTESPQPVVSAQKVENVQVTEAYCQSPDISAEKVDEQSYTKPESTDWTDKALEDYNVLQHHVKPYEDVPRQPQPAEIYDYIIPEPELVGFIGSQLGAYPVSSYVYAPAAGHHHHHHHHHHQQVQQQLDSMNLNPYNNGSLTYAPEHYVAQTAYLSATEIYQQAQMQQPQQQQQCPAAGDMRCAAPILIQNVEKPVQMQVVHQPEVTVAAESIDKSEQQEESVVSVSNVAEASTTSKTEGKDVLPLINNETKNQTFSYAQILSQGLSPRVTPTRVINKTSAVEQPSKERSYSPKESLSSRELSPLQESKIIGKDSQQPLAKLEQPRQSKENDWDTMKKREVKKKQQSMNEKPKQADERKSQNPVDKSKERQKKEKSSPPKQIVETRDESMSDQIVDSSDKKEEKPMQQEKRTIDSVDTSAQEKRRKPKKKKMGKAGGDEIDKALKEIENMDKQKAKSQKDKLKEQNKSRESVIETLDKSKDETDKKQTKSGERSKKVGKSKEAARAKENTPVRQDILSSQVKAPDQSILKDNIKVKDDINDTKDLSSKGEEEDRKGSTKEELKDQPYITDDSHVNHNKSDTKTKHKNKTGKNMKEGNGEGAESTAQQQSSVPSDDTKEKINIVDENSSTEIAKSSDTQKVPLKNIIERPSATTKAESTTRQKDTSKREQLSKSKTKSKELKLEVECNNKNREKLENDVKEMLKNSPPESNKSLVDAEVKDPKPKVLDSAKVVEVNGNVKGKANSRKKDKASKGKMKTEVTIDLTSSTVPTSEALNETEVSTCSDNAEKVIVPKSEQITEEISRIVEMLATVTKEPDFKEVSKEIVLSPKINQQTEETIQTDIIHKSDKIDRNETEAKESIENERMEHRQADAKLKIDSAMSPESPETIGEKKAFISDTNDEKTEKRETEKRQTKTGKQKRSDKTKSSTQDTDKPRETIVEVPLPVESKNKSTGEEDKLKVESSSKSLIEPIAETFVQPAEKTHFAKEDVSVSDDSYLTQSKSDAKGTDDVKTDEKEITANVQVNKRAPEATSKSKKKGKSKDKSKDAQQARNTKPGELKLKDEIATTELQPAQQIASVKEDITHNKSTELVETVPTSNLIPTATAETETSVLTKLENVATIVPAAETLLKVFETSLRTDNAVTKVEEKCKLVESEKLDRSPQEAVVKDEEVKADAIVKDPLRIRELQDTGKSKDLATKESTPKHTKKEKLKSAECAVEQTKHSRDKLGKKIAPRDDSTKEEEFPRHAPTDQCEVDQEKLDENQSSRPQIESPEIQQTQELSEKTVTKTEVDSKLSSDLVDEAKVHDGETRNDSPSSTGKALIIEKTVTTVTTTTSVPGSVKVKPPDVKSVKSVEILENIPLPKIVGSKVTELITLRPETVEASLTTTYARVPSDANPVNNCPVQSADQATNSQRVGSTSLASIFTENIVTCDESTLFGSVQDRRRVCPEISKDRDISEGSPVITAPEERREESIIDENDEMTGQEQLISSNEFVQQGDQSEVAVPEEKCEKDNAMRKTISDDTVLQNDIIIGNQNINNSAEENNVTLNNEVNEGTSNIQISKEKERIDEEKINVEAVTKNTREVTTEVKVSTEAKCEIEREGTPEIAKAKKQIMPEYLLDLVKPYALDRHVYNHAESNFYRYFKVVKVIKEPQPLAPVVQARPESIVRIVQESVMKLVEQSNEEEADVSCRRHALIMEAPKYPLASLYEFESHWMRAKSVAEKSLSISSDDTEISLDSVIEKVPLATEEKATLNTVNTTEPEQITMKETTAKVLTDGCIDNQDKKDEREIKEEQSSKDTVPDFEEGTTVINVEKVKVTETSESLEVPQATIIAEVSLSDKRLDSLINEDKDEELKNVKQTVHLVSDDSWMSILDEPMIIDDDFDDTSEPEKITMEETTAKVLTDSCVDNQDKKDKKEIKEESSKDTSNIKEVPPCAELPEGTVTLDRIIDNDFDDTSEPEKIMEETTAKVLTDSCLDNQDKKDKKKIKEESSKDTSNIKEVPPCAELPEGTVTLDTIIDNVPSKETDLIIKTDDSIPIGETSKEFVQSTIEEISDTQLTDADVITDTNIHVDEIVAEDKVEVAEDKVEVVEDKVEVVEEKSGTKATPTVAPSVHLESDDAWMTLLEEEITLDDDFDMPETQVKKESKVEKEDKEIEKMEKVEQQKEGIEKEEAEIQVLNKTTLTEIAVKGEYFAGIKDTQNETVNNEKPIDKAKDQSKKKKESKHTKDAKTKDQAKSKAGSKKQNEVEIKPAVIESESLPTQYQLEEIKVKATNAETKEVENLLITDGQQTEESKFLPEELASKQKEQNTVLEAHEKPPPKREEVKPRSRKKSKKQSEKSEAAQDKLAKRDGKIDDNVSPKDQVKEIEPNVADVSAIVQKEQDSQDEMPKYDSRLNPNAKSWAAIVGTKSTTETITVPEDDSLSSQMSTIVCQDATDSGPSVFEQIPETLIEHDSCEVPLKPEMCATPPKTQASQNVIEESQVATVEEAVEQPVVEKSAESSEQLREGSKSYAQVAASSRRTSPQASQEEIYLIKPVPLKSDHKVIDVRAPVLDESCRNTGAEELQSPSEQEIIPIDETTTVRQIADNETIVAKSTPQIESIPWVEEMEEETSIVSSDSHRAVDLRDTEISYAKPETNTWAAIVGKKSVESPEVNNASSFEQVSRKADQNVEQRPPTHVQIYVDEAPEQEPIEKLVQVDDQGFMEFINRKELRSRRSRSRSRSDKRDDGHVTVEASDSVKDKEIKLNTESQRGENTTAKGEVEDKQPARQQEIEQKQMDELTTVIKEDVPKEDIPKEDVPKEDVPKEIVKTTKSRDKSKQKKDSNERKKDERNKKDKKQSAEISEIQSDESKIIQETKSEQDEAPKGKKAKTKKNKSGKDSMKQQPEIKAQKELKNIEETIKEDPKPANESGTPDEIQLKNIVTESQELQTIEDQSTKEAPDTEIAQDIKNKDTEVLPSTEKSSVTKSKKKSRNKKGKVIASEQTIENVVDTVKKTVNENVEKKIESPIEPKLDDEVKIKLEEGIAENMVHNAPTSLENEKISTENTNKQENIEQLVIPEKITEQGNVEQKTTLDEPESTSKPKESHLENVEENVTEQKEIAKLTKSAKRKQRKKAKVSSRNEVTEKKEIKPTEEDFARGKSTDSFSETNITQEVKAEEVVNLTDETVNIVSLEDKIDIASELKKDNEERTEIQAVEVEELEKCKKSEAAVENEASLLQITPIANKREQKDKSKPKKEKRQDDETIKSSQEDSTNILMTDSKKVESLSITENAKTLSSFKEAVAPDSQQNEENNVEDNVGDKKLDNEPAGILQYPEDKIDTNDLPATTAATNEEEIKEQEPLVSSTKREIKKESATINVDEDISVNEDKMDKTNISSPNNEILTKREIMEESAIINVDENISTDEDKMDKTNTSSPSTEIPTQAEPSSDPTGTVIKHSPSLDKLSFIAQQCFDDEDKRVASIEQESSSSDLSSAPPKSKVQFYIADEILVLKPEKRKDIVPPESLLQKRPDDFYNSRFLSIDGGFWPDKRPYHEAERDHFENLALHTKKNLSRDPDDRHRSQDRDGDNSGDGGGGGRSRDSCGNSRSLLGAPQTERMVADLPGGICSWSDYSTYLSCESERTVEPVGPPLDATEDPTIDSGLSLDYSSPSDIQSLPDLLLPPPPSSSSTHDHPQTESRTESSVDAEVSPRECPAVSSSSSLQSPDHPTSTSSSTFAHLRPQSKLHLGRETGEESVQRCSPNGVAERETAEGEAERIRRIQGTVEEVLASLQARLSNLEGTMGCLPQDSIESMLSSLMTVLAELHTYDEEATQLQGRLREIPADVESQRLSTALTGIHTRVTALLDQAEQGRAALEQARDGRGRRDQEIRTYRLFLDETDAWLRDVASKIHEQHSINTNKTLQDELENRARRVSELESLPEVSELAATLKEALLDVIGRLQQKQQVSYAYQGSGAFANFTLLRASVALK